MKLGKILLLSLVLVSSSFSEEVKEANETKKESVIETNLGDKIVAKDWIAWIESLGKNKNIDKITKKKIYSGAEIIAEKISIDRSFEITEVIGENNLEWQEHNKDWIIKEQEKTMILIGTKLSGMTFSELVEIHEKYGKKEVKKKEENK